MMQTGKKIQNQAIRRLVRRNFKKNRLRNGILVIAIALVTMLMTIMFGAGISVFHNVQLADLRTKGTVANGVLPKPKSGELEKIEKLPEISQTGWQQFAAEAWIGDVRENQGSVAMTAYDPVEWEKHIVPTLSDIRGEFPREANEVMLSEWVLKQMNIHDPKPGMTVTVNFTALDGKEDIQDFILCGYYKDYIYQAGSSPNSGNTLAANLYYSDQGSTRRAIGNIVVSEAFARQNGTAAGTFGTFLIDDGLDADEALDLLYKTTGRKDAIVMGLSNNPAQALSVVAMPFAAVIL